MQISWTIRTHEHIYNRTEHYLVSTQVTNEDKQYKILSILDTVSER
jgi:hypothetical protein